MIAVIRGREAKTESLCSISYKIKKARSCGPKRVLTETRDVLVGHFFTLSLDYYHEHGLNLNFLPNWETKTEDW